MKPKARAVKEEKGRLSKAQEMLYMKDFKRANKAVHHNKKS